VEKFPVYGAQAAGRPLASLWLVSR